MHSSLDKISVYDIGTHQWYQQAASGDIPSWRYIGCSVTVSALDHSSHSIYIFGGWGDSAEASDGNVYVLSIPSFQWIRVNEDSSLRARPQCVLVGANTMLVVGGIQPNGNDLQPFDASGCVTSQMFSNGLGMFSLNLHTWSSNYEPLEASAFYKVHPAISKVIGGTENGNATVRTPVGGFSQQALGTLLGAQEVSNATPPKTSPMTTPIPSLTPSPTTATTGSAGGGKKGLGRSAIAGTCVAVGFVTILVLLVFYLKWCRGPQRKPALSELPASIGKVPELSAAHNFPELPPPSPAELLEPRTGTHELGSTEKPLPSRLGELASTEIQEMGG